MQGGHVDGVSPAIASAVSGAICQKRRKKHKERDDPDASSGSSSDEAATMPIDTLTEVEPILISPAVDAALERGRTLFALALATPIAWVHLDATVARSKARKLGRVKAGTEAVVALQAWARCPPLDAYFGFWSFFAEEEFYLLFLPITFWNVDYAFARQMTFVVCAGLLWGNLLKDVFRLPRPANVSPGRVWVPASATHMDSTACRDFGFPSTHAMNAVSNSLFTVLYCAEHGYGGLPRWVVIALALGWVFSLGFGRLYLGVHSPMDVKGGLLLGGAVALLAQWPGYACEAFDAALLTTPYIGLVLLAALVGLLLANPQPRPMTPTFLQNCTLAGLIFGCAIGFRMEHDRRRGFGLFNDGAGGAWAAAAAASRARAASPDFFPGHPRLATAKRSAAGAALGAARTVAGFVLILLVRAVLKASLAAGFRGLFGLDPSPAKSLRDIGKEGGGGKGKKAFTLRGWDLFAAATVKFSVYTALAWMITSGCPAFFDAVLGMPLDTYQHERA